MESFGLLICFFVLTIFFKFHCKFAPKSSSFDSFTAILLYTYVLLSGSVLLIGASVVFAIDLLVIIVVRG